MRAKKKGLRGPPCLLPLVERTWAELTGETRRKALEDSPSAQASGSRAFMMKACCC
jgi:hypothetical protein